ncbi:SRPBCC domain-containing protein [Enterococcus olivae]
MQERFYYDEEVLHVEYRLLITKEVAVVWRYLTETAKIQEWFKEISVGNLQKNSYLLFTFPDHEIKMKILTFKPEKEISFEWAEGTVQFELVSQGKETQLCFYETLTKDFTEPIRDISGWYIQLERLQNTIEGESTTFDLNKFQQTEVRIGKMIMELKESHSE